MVVQRAAVRRGEVDGLGEQRLVVETQGLDRGMAVVLEQADIQGATSRGVWGVGRIELADPQLNPG